MPTYDYRCESCGTVREIVHSIKSNPEFSCEKCPGKMVRTISRNFGGFTFKNGTTTIHQRERDRRKKRDLARQEGIKSGKAYGPKIKPNIAGVETGSWSDAQKMAKEAGMAHDSFTPWVEKEKKEKRK